MKLAFSNIAWDAVDEPNVLPILSEADITGIEIAPTKCWPGWAGATPSAVKRLASRLTTAGFVIPSVQAILFGRPELKVFGSESEHLAFLAHIDEVARIASGLGAKTLVFGSPTNRDPGQLTPEEAMRAATPIFKAAGELCVHYGVQLGIEANPPVYGCRFVTHWFEAAELVRRCDTPGIRLHLDAACTALAGDDLGEAVAKTTDILTHVHISEPHLSAFDSPTVDHAAFGNALKASGYDGWCSVEMRRQDDPVTAIRKAAMLARSLYG